VIIMVIKKLRFVTKNFDVLGYSSTSQLSGHPTLINDSVIFSVVRRVVLYPVVPLVAQFFSSFVETYAYINRVVSYPLFLLCFVGMSIQGLLNALVFSQDIAVARTFQDIKLHWWISIVNSYESHYPHRSHNKSVMDDFSTLGKANDLVELQFLNYKNADI
ncbi:18844_t:CDS:2, partial [Racocetra persica]